MADRKPLIEAKGVEKFYPAPDGHRIQVIAPLDITIYSDKFSPCSVHRAREIDPPSNSDRFLQPSSGDIQWNGQRERAMNLAIVFQSFALFPCGFSR